MQCEVTKHFCNHCQENHKVFLSASKRRICDNCRQVIFTEPRECLKCEKYFMPVSKFNRLCNLCNNENDGVELYEFFK
jgi:hypothetical protein